MIRDGYDASVFAMGHMVYRALQARKLLEEKGVSLRVYGVSCP